ncbi:MAG: hypothetical protein RJA36_426 [Pseudomonadota bacterium]|jgi:ribonucleoside-diphosphate reductase alpha chain
MDVIKRDGSREAFDFAKIERLNEFATQDLNVDLGLLRSQIRLLVYDGMHTSEIFQAQNKAAAGLISTQNPDFTFVAARYLLAETMKIATGSARYPALADTIARGVAAGRYAPRMAEAFDLAALDAAIRPERDFQFDYYGLQNLVDRYLMRDREQQLIELPQHFFMRVAMGVALQEDDPTARAIQFYDLLSSFDYMASTPTLFNSGTVHSQLSSCYLNTVNDQISADPAAGEHRFASIFGTIEESARLSKYAGGIGTDWTRVRAAGSHIQSTNGKSSGVIPYLKIYNDTAVGVNQGGRRKGSFAPYLEVWHPDFWDYCELKKEFGDDRLRAHDIFPAAWVCDLFMERVESNGVWSEFQPQLYPELHELHGDAFKARYEQLEREGRAYKQRPAMEVWKRILTNLFETGHPWITFKDECNRRSPQDHVGVVHSSNLCCMTADQRVVTDRGLMTVGELYRLGGRNKVVGMDGVYTASEMLLPRPNAPIVRIETNEGYSHKVTPDHKVWVKDRGWVEAQHLVPGDKLLTQQLEGLWGQQHNPELGYLMGLIAGDGTFGEHNVFIDVWKNDFACLQTTTETVHQVLNGNTVLNTTSVNTPQFRIDPQLGKARLASAPLRRVLAEHGFTPETKTQVPALVWQGDRATVAAYLRGLYQADGNIVASHEVTTMALASIDLGLIESLQILWANFGVKSSINQMRSHEEHELPDGRGGKKAYWSKPLYRLLITSIQGCRIAESVTQLAASRTSEASTRFLENLKKDGYTQKLHATFKGLVNLPNEDAYCLSVDSETHAWTVNGLITKNTEITLNTSDSETAVCNLGSVNLARHVKDGQLDGDKLARTVGTALRMLDNVIDLNFYPSDRARASNLRHRPVGLGLMGETEAKVACGIAFDSAAGVAFSDQAMELISFHAIAASCGLAAERGAYESFPGSKWSRGLLPIDTARSRETRLGEAAWAELRARVQAQGMRNSNVMAIAPTATISILTGTTPCIEPIFEIERSEKNMSGQFKVVDPCVRYGRPDLLKTVWEIDPSWILRSAAARQKWIDQAQSVNIFVKQGTKGRELAEIYLSAWKLGLKTTYYLRGQTKTKEVTKTAIAAAALPQASQAQASEPANFCSIDNPDCEACQ